MDAMTDKDVVWATFWLKFAGKIASSQLLIIFCALHLTFVHRDALLCSIIDGVRASGNKDICVKMGQTKRGHRLGPLNLPVGEEVESQYLKYIVNLPQGVRYSEAVERFNANVSYSGLNHAVSQEVSSPTLVWNIEFLTIYWEPRYSSLFTAAQPMLRNCSSLFGAAWFSPALIVPRPPMKYKAWFCPHWSAQLLLDYLYHHSQAVFTTTHRL